MKKFISILLGMLLLILLGACGRQGESSLEPHSQTSNSQASASTQKAPNTPSDIVEFTDKLLENAVRNAMQKPTGDITLKEAQAVTSLNLSNSSFDDMTSKNGGIRDISALKHFTGLRELDISFNQISNLTPISSLSSLETLVFSGTWVEDISPLKDLPNIKCLIFCWMRGANGTPGGIENLDALSGLKNLEMLDAKNSGIKDVKALADLPKLWEVQLNENVITDVSPLAKIKNIKALFLSGNPNAEYGLLKDIYGQLDGKDFEIK